MLACEGCLMMIDWWFFFHNSLWLVGLAVALAAFSMASYQAREEKVRLRQKFSEPALQLPFNLGLALFCLGLLFGGQIWWEQALWGLLAVLFLGQVVRLWRKQG